MNSSGPQLSTVIGRFISAENNSSTNRIFSSHDTANIIYDFNHDARGNVIRMGGTSLTYDMTDQPIAMSGTAPNTGNSVNATYLYDGNMKRVRSIIDTGSGPKTIYNVYDASGQLVHVDEETDGIETDYLHGMGQTLARIKDSGTGDVFTYLHPDHLGSPQVGTEGITGAVEFTEHYTPFGEALLNPAANDNQSGFTGHIKDKSTGLNYMQARYYDPNIGRFLSVDPVGFMDTGDPRYFNKYAYVGNDPVNYIDPFGEELIKTEEVIQNDNGTTTTNVNLKFDAAFSVDGGELPKYQSAQGLANTIASAIESTYTGSKTDSDGNTVNYNMEADIRVGSASGTETAISYVADGSYSLKGGIGHFTIGNRYQIHMSDRPDISSNSSDFGRTGAHEFGHAFGLQHQHTGTMTIMAQSWRSDSRLTSNWQMNKLRKEAIGWHPPLK